MRHKIPKNLKIEVIAYPNFGRAIPQPIYSKVANQDFQIEKIEVKARSRRLTAEWTVETGEIWQMNLRFTKR